MILANASFLGGIDNLYVALVSTWLCINIVYLSLDNAKKHKNKYLNDVIALSIVFAATAGFILLYSIERIKPQTSIFSGIFFPIVIGFLSVLMICLFVYFKNRKLHFLALFLIVAGVIGLYVPLLYFEIDFYYPSIGITFFYVLIAIIVMIKMLVQKKDYGLGLMYTIGSAIVLCSISFLGKGRNPEIIALAKLFLSLFVSLSFFIFYCQTNSKAISEKDEIVKIKADLLEEAEKKIATLGLVNQDTKIKNIHRFEYDITNNAYKITHLLMLNLDNYRVMYNYKGYKQSIEIILQVVAELNKVIDKKGELYHISNDKFIISLNCNNEECGVMVRKVLDIFQRHEFFTINLKPYIGFTNVINRTLNYENILKELELASEAAHESSEFYAAYNYEMYNKIQRRIGMELYLKKACDEKLWELYLQPKVYTEINVVCGAEGLIRWKGQEGKVSPAQFIPLAEEMGLIVDIGKTILEKGFEYAKIIASIDPEFVLSVNLSAYQLMRKDFVQYVLETVKKKQTNPKNIAFEITESSFIDNMDRVKSAILELREVGFRFSLDDFGTGYSSISYLSSFELDEVKFDKDFTSTLGKPGDKNIYILKTVADLGRSLDYHIVTEGIETEEQLEIVKNVGCEVYQGYYFSKPVPFEEFVPILRKNHLENADILSKYRAEMKQKALNKKSSLQ